LNRNNIFTKNAFLLLIFGIFVSLVIIISQFSNTNSQDSILGQTWCGGINPCSIAGDSDVTVSAFIRINHIDFTVYPEKRQPSTGNWGTFIDFVLEDCVSSNTYTFSNIPTDPLGNGRIEIPAINPLLDGDYRFFAKGNSHLNEEFNCYTLETINPYINLTLEGKELLAGEVSTVYDNYINSLDMSVLINALFTSNSISDLNHDSVVNALDFGNQIYNLFVAGD